ncbi:Carboxylesterase [Hyaloraphidium curvatum]|nr:Carboxylesterase [Hyaloraphidium curvatum]
MLRPAAVLAGLAALLFAAPAALAQNVALDYITLQGATASGTSSWKGIPYAAAPVGNLRFRAPQPPVAVSGVYNATAYKDGCIASQMTGSLPRQKRQRPPIGGGSTSEDCLTLNVIVPEGTTEGANLPVMVWVHGGAFMSGSASGTDGASLVVASNGTIVFVSIQYRLNVFGFIGGEEVIREGVGNLGLQDQAAAFQWIRKYISKFGGNPNNITAFGQSAGSQSVALQTIAYNGTQNLFDRAIMESGTYVSFHDIYNATEQALGFAQVAAGVGCGSNATLACLRTVSASNLSSASAGLNWRPIVDKKLFYDAPMKMVEAGRSQNLPIILGTTTNEGTMFASSATDFVSFLNTNFPSLNASSIAEVERLYPASAFNSTTLRAAEVFGDVVFVCPSENYAAIYATRGVNSVYDYRWDYATSSTNGAAHGAEISFVFNAAKTTESEDLLADVSSAYWRSFGRTADPNTYRYPNSTAWPLYKNGTSTQLLMTTPALQMTTVVAGAYMPGHAERCAFWRQYELGQAAGYYNASATVLPTGTASTVAPTATVSTTSRPAGAGRGAGRAAVEIAAIVAGAAVLLL